MMVTQPCLTIGIMYLDDMQYFFVFFLHCILNGCQFMLIALTM